MSSNVFVATPEQRQNLLRYFTFTSTARPRAGQLQPTDPSRGRCRATRPLRPLPLSYPPRVRRSTRPALSALPLLSPPPFPSPGQVVQCLSNLLPAHGSDPVAPPSRVAILTRDSVRACIYPESRTGAAPLVFQARCVCRRRRGLRGDATRLVVTHKETAPRERAVCRISSSGRPTSDASLIRVRCTFQVLYAALSQIQTVFVLV